MFVLLAFFHTDLPNNPELFNHDIYNTRKAGKHALLLVNQILISFMAESSY